MSNGTTNPRSYDILFGRGAFCNRHHGNVIFRALIETYKDQYSSSTREQKTGMAQAIVDHVRSMGGQFLEKGRYSFWFDVGDERAAVKTGRVLRGRCVSYKPRLKKRTKLDGTKEKTVSTESYPGDNVHKAEELKQDYPVLEENNDNKPRSTGKDIIVETASSEVSGKDVTETASAEVCCKFIIETASAEVSGKDITETASVEVSGKDITKIASAKVPELILSSMDFHSFLWFSC